MTINIGNLRQTKVGIKCDRTSDLGNPFWMLQESDRDDVCYYHNIYFNLIVDEGHTPKAAIDAVLARYPWARIVKGWRVPTREEFMVSLTLIQDGDTILCWCHPKRCHLDTVKQFLEQKFYL